MASVIDTKLNAYLGLPDGYQLNKNEAFELYQHFHNLFPCDSNIKGHTLEYYVDKNGDFVNDPKNKRDYVVKAIFDNLDKNEQFEILKYIEYHKETQGFTSFE